MPPVNPPIRGPLPRGAISARKGVGEQALIYHRAGDSQRTLDAVGVRIRKLQSHSRTKSPRRHSCKNAGDWFRGNSHWPEVFLQTTVRCRRLPVSVLHQGAAHAGACEFVTPTSKGQVGARSIRNLLGPRANRKTKKRHIPCCNSSNAEGDWDGKIMGRARRLSSLGHSAPAPRIPT